MSKEIKICIGGVQGYVGGELVKLVNGHPYLKLVGILARNSKTQRYSEQNISIYSLAEINEQQVEIDVLLLATPPESSIEIIASLINSNIKIIDLSGAFRLSVDELHQWYGIKHQIPELINGAIYGLSPWEINNINNHKVVANPGCYATCTLMSLIPLLKQNVIDNSNIIIDAKSGVSGAGKKANQNLMFCEMTENFFPYKVAKHQHIPEITNACAQFANKSCHVTFTTHMLPVKRGISLSIYADAHSDFTSDEEISAAIESAYKLAYKAYPLAQFGEINQGNVEKNKFLLSLKTVVGTAEIHIAYCVDGGKVFVFACIDNLLKGAASQAIENINGFYHFPLETGLLYKEVKP